MRSFKAAAATRLITVLLLAGSITFAQDVKGIYLDRCALCHGVDGLANTPKGRKLKVNSAKLMTLKDSQAAMIKAVSDGKGSDMDGYKSDFGPEQIKALVDYYRTLGK